MQLAGGTLPPSPLPFWLMPLLAVCGIVTAVAIYWRNKRRSEKRLIYEFSPARISNVSSHKFAGKISILFEDKPVPGAAIATIRVRSAGLAPILRNDFDAPLQFTFSEFATVLSAEASETKLVVELNWGVTVGDGHRIEVAPLLLNTGDEFTVFALLSEYPTRCTAIARIAGLKEIERKGDHAASSSVPDTLPALFVCFSTSTLVRNVFTAANINLSPKWLGLVP